MTDLRVPDVSQWQRRIGWPELVGYLRSDYGGAVAIVRLCYGDLLVDAQADANIDGARGAGADILGWYLYLVAGRAVEPQADTFVRVLRAHGGLRRGEFVCVDAEEATAGEDVPARVNAALDSIDAQLQVPHPSGQDWWYSGLNFAAVHHLQSARGHRVIAAYQAAEPTSIAHDLWQFTDAATVPGIAAPVDCSVFRGSLADLRRLIGGPVPTASAGGADMGLVAMSYRPGGTGTVDAPSGYRLDLAGIDATGAMWHAWSNQGAAASGWEHEDLGAPAGGFDAAYGAGCTWDDRGTATTFTAVGKADRRPYRRVLWGLEGSASTATPPTGWDAMDGVPALPPLPAVVPAPVPLHHHLTGPGVADA